MLTLSIPCLPSTPCIPPCSPCIGAHTPLVPLLKLTVASSPAVKSSTCNACTSVAIIRSTAYGCALRTLQHSSQLVVQGVAVACSPCLPPPPGALPSQCMPLLLPSPVHCPSLAPMCTAGNTWNGYHGGFNEAAGYDHSQMPGYWEQGHQVSQEHILARRTCSLKAAKLCTCAVLPCLCYMYIKDHAY